MIENLQHQDGGDASCSRSSRRWNKLDRREATPHSGFGVPDNELEVIAEVSAPLTDTHIARTREGVAERGPDHRITAIVNGDVA